RSLFRGKRWTVNFSRSLAAVLIVVGAAVPAFAQDRTTLKWRFVKDLPFYQEVSSEMTQTMKVAGSDVKNVQKQTFHSKWTPLAQDNQGNWVLKQKIERVKIDIEV